MTKSVSNKLKILYPVLFTLYVISFSFFTHSHIVNNTRYVHSHPFDFGEQNKHKPTDNELELLDQIFNTSLTTDILPQIDLSGNTPETRLVYTNLYRHSHQIGAAISLQLRAPPTF